MSKRKRPTFSTLEVALDSQSRPTGFRGTHIFGSIGKGGFVSLAVSHPSPILSAAQLSTFAAEVSDLAKAASYRAKADEAEA